MTQIFFTLLVILSTNLSYAEETLLLRIHGENRWELSASAREGFENFLAGERADLLARLPDLNFPVQFQSMQEGVFQYGIASSTEFKNREVSCAFLSRVSQGLSGSDKKTFGDLTKNSSLCIPRDVPGEERSAWSLSLMKFFWTRPWIPKGGKLVSLEEQIIEAIGIQDYVRPEIRILTAVDFDAYGYDQSPQDKLTVANNPKLKKIYEIAKNFDPNHPETIGELGPEIKKLAREHSVKVADYFIQQPTIYMTDNWSPEAVVEVLAHEYGHVLHNGTKSILTDHGSWLGITDDKVHNEAAAEAVAWQALCDIYDQFPETKIFHILKLRLFTQYKPQDAHLMGAAAFAPFFHSSCGKNHGTLLDFLASPGLQPFLAKHRSDALSFSGADVDTDMHIVWQ